MTGHNVAPYLRSDDPAVIATIERNESTTQEFGRECIAFAQKYGVKPQQEWRSEPHPLVGGWGGLALVGITGDKPIAGQWRSIKRGWAPFVKNPVHKEMSAIRRTLEPVPGLPSMVTAKNVGSEGILWMRPRPFLSGGSAWVMMSHPGVSSEPLGEQWREVLGSEAMAAREAIEAGS